VLWEDRMRTVILESEDLPVICTVNHEELVEYVNNVSRKAVSFVLPLFEMYNYEPFLVLSSEACQLLLRTIFTRISRSHENPFSWCTPPKGQNGDNNLYEKTKKNQFTT
jgi:hypothetical protein